MWSGGGKLSAVTRCQTYPTIASRIASVLHSVAHSLYLRTVHVLRCSDAQKGSTQIMLTNVNKGQKCDLLYLILFKLLLKKFHVYRI